MVPFTKSLLGLAWLSLKVARMISDGPVYEMIFSIC